MPNYTHDHEITVDSTTKRVNLVRDANGQAMFSVIEDVPEYRNGVLFAQNDWTHGHGQYSVADTQAYFDGEAIDTTQEGRVILGPRINEVWTGAVQKQYYTTGQDASGAVYDVNWFAQTFTPADTHTVTAVKLYLKKNNVENTPGTITVSIRATSSSKPTGSDLCVATYDGNNLPTSYGWIPFVFCPGVSLTISTKYAIVLRAPNADTTNQVSWGHDESTPSYTGGARSGSTDSGVTWGSEETSIDCLFDEYAAGDTALDTAPVCFLWSPTASKLLCATSGKIYYYNGITWTAATTTVAGVVDLKEYNGKIYAACGSGDNFWYSTDADTWTECTLTDHHAVKFLSAPNAAGTANVFWKLMTANELTSSTNPVNSGTEFTTPAYIGDTTSNVTNIFLFNDELMVGRQDNLYNYDNAGGIHALMNELMHARSTNNFKYVVNFQSGVYFSLGTKVGELIGTSPGVFSDVSPLSNTGDIDKVGVCVGITSDTDYLYVAMLEGTRTHIYKGRKTASGWNWCPWVCPAENNCRTIYIAQHSATDRRLWFGYGTHTAYVQVTDNPTTDSNARFNSYGWVRMSYAYGTHPYWDKLIQSITTETSGCSAGVTVYASYFKNTDDLSEEGVPLTAVITTNGIVETKLTTALNYNKIMPEIYLETNDGTFTPQVKMLMLNGFEKPETVRVYECVYVAGDEPSKRSKTLRDFFRTARSSASLVKLADLRYGESVSGTSYKWVSMLPGYPQEVEIIQEKGRQPELGIKVRWQEVDFTVS